MNSVAAAACHLDEVGRATETDTTENESGERSARCERRGRGEEVVCNRNTQLTNSLAERRGAEEAPASERERTSDERQTVERLSKRICLVVSYISLVHLYVHAHV